MEFRIAARQIDRVRAGGGRFVGEGREEGKLRPRMPPAVEDMWVGEGKSGVLGDGNSLAEWR